MNGKDETRKVFIINGIPLIIVANITWEKATNHEGELTGLSEARFDHARADLEASILSGHDGNKSGLPEREECRTGREL